MTSFMFELETSLLLKNSGMCVRIVKYISNFLLHFSKENLQPRRNVISILSSKSEKKIILQTVLICSEKKESFETNYFFLI